MTERERDASIDAKATEKQRAKKEQEARIARVLAKQAAKWKAKWPEHCKVCGGKGGSTFYQSHGDGGRAEPLFEPCQECGNGKCPRCGEFGLNPDTDDGPCAWCGWNYDDACPEY